MKKALLSLIFVLCVLMLAACGRQEEDEGPKDVSAETASGVVTEMTCGEAELHEAIVPWVEEGETFENAYYQRTVDADGNLVYAVMKAADEQLAYLPLGETVVYTGVYETCYYEVVEISYKMNGELVSQKQYHLYVNTDAAVVDEAQP